MDQPIIFEVFTDGIDESDALAIISSLQQGETSSLKDKMIDAARKLIGDKGVVHIKSLLGK